MAVQDKSGGTCSNLIATSGNRICLDVGTHPVNGIQPKEIYSSSDEHVLKVRKPYTITKQRERWTEEEHKKFLEALTLYGRAWRRIEDHVGTKTAVQIRSHAQKFFSKVVRESSGSDVASVKPIEIPPPRPKRKPMHPYPRKLVHSLKNGMSIPEKPERSPSPNLSVSEHAYQSPKSVLSGFGSEMIGSSTVSNLNTNTPSPVSELLSEQETGYLSSTSAANEENYTMPSIQVTANSTPQIESLMKFDFGSKDDACTKEGSEGEAPKMSLKLFGRTVLVTDSHRPSSSTVGSSKSSTNESYEEKLGTNEEKQNPMQKDSNCSPWPCGMPPAFYYMQAHKDDPEPVEAISSTPVPWWALYGGLQFAFLQNPQSAEVPPEFSLEKEGVIGIGDKSGDVVNSQSEEPSSDKEKEMGPVFQLRSSETSVFSERSDRCMKGFVPYKRCIAERDVQSSGIVREDREGQRIRLCL